MTTLGIGEGNAARSAASAAGLTGVNAIRCIKPSIRRYTAVDRPPISCFDLPAIASNTGCASFGELAMTFNISAVAACCARASFRSFFGPETERRLTRLVVGAMRGLALVVLRPFPRPALRVFAALVLLPVVI